MQQAFFHKQYAWNLMETAYRDGMIKRNEHWKKNLKLGIDEGWLNPEKERSALQMLVLFDQVLLPGDLDVDLHSTPIWKEEHVRWAGSLFRDLEFVDPPWNVDDIEAFRPFIQSALTERGHFINDNEYGELINLWRTEIHLRNENWIDKKRYTVSPALEATLLTKFIEMNENQENLERANMARKRIEEIKSFLEQQEEYSEVATLILEETHSFHESLFLANKGIPTFGYGAELPSIAHNFQSSLREMDESVPSILKVYFENVRYPAPTTLREALNMRDNQSIQKWRNQILSWSYSFINGDIDLKRIEQEIKEANSYIEGAEVLSELIPSRSVFITLPLGILMQFIPGLQPLGWGLLMLDGLNAYGQLVKQTVTAPDRMKYPWLMISDEKKKRTR